MKLTFSPHADQTVAFLQRQGYRGSGLLIGSAMGQFLIVEAALPIPLRKTDLDATLAAAWATWPHDLLGVFFMRQPPLRTAHLGRLAVCRFGVSAATAWFADNRAPIAIVRDQEAPA
jgi:hypothetical protein